MDTGVKQKAKNVQEKITSWEFGSSEYWVQC